MAKKITVNNTFDGGLVADLSAMNNPKNTLSSALNMEIITVGDNQYILQNQRGNTNKNIFNEIMDLGSYYNIDDGITYPFIPQGVKVFNNIAYIIAGAFKVDDNDKAEFLAGTVGTFPSPVWEDLNDPDIGVSKLEEVFRPLHNFATSDALDDYTKPFVSKLFALTKHKYIDIVLQGTYDGSVNIIFTDDSNKIRIINSRFKNTKLNVIYKIAERRGVKDSNVYNDGDWERISLIQNAAYPITVTGPTVGVGGVLKGGGYRYFLKYVSQEGNATDIIYESPLIPIANGSLGITKSQASDKKVSFALSGLDKSYAGIRVYFAIFDGYPTATTETYKIDYLYSYNGDETTLVVVHTGLESVTAVDIAEINTSFSPVDTVRSVEIISDRLALAGVTSSLPEEELTVMEAAAKSITIWEDTEQIDTDYSDPETAANKVGYWRGEVYELAVVFKMLNKGDAPAFPLTGLDNFDNVLDTNEFTWPNYDQAELDTVAAAVDGFSTPNLINHKGIFRTSELGGTSDAGTEQTVGQIYDVNTDGVGLRTLTYLKCYVGGLLDFSMAIGDKTIFLKDIVTGYKIVRRRRIKNVLMQGMSCPTLKAPSRKNGPINLYFITNDDGNENHASDNIHSRFTMPHCPLGYKYLTGADARIWGRPSIGLNTRFETAFQFLPIDAAPEDPKTKTTIGPEVFNTVFAPQPTQLLSMVGTEVSNLIAGAVGQLLEISDGRQYQHTLNTSTELSDTMHLAFYSVELELNQQVILESLTGTSPAIHIQNARLNTNTGPGGPVVEPMSPLGVTTSRVAYSGVPLRNPTPFNERIESDNLLEVDQGTYTTSDQARETPQNAIIRIASKISYNTTFTEVAGEDTKLLFVSDGTSSYTQDSFTSKIDRTFGVPQYATGVIAAYYRREIDPDIRTDIYNYIRSNTNYTGIQGGFGQNRVLDFPARNYYVENPTQDNDRSVAYIPVALLTQSYSSYIGITIKSPSIPSIYYNNVVHAGPTAPTFNGEFETEGSGQNNDATSILRYRGVPLVANESIVNLGHLTNVFSSSTGRWKKDDIKDIFKYDSSSPYFLCTDQKALPLVNTASIDVWRGDGFISRIFKRITYKSGVGATAATPEDAALYGIGVTDFLLHNYVKDNRPVSYFKDKGRNLYDVGQIIELAHYSNINGDIRSVDLDTTTADKTLLGYDKDFYPNREQMMGDSRPDSIVYNHGYTGDQYIIPYFKIEETAAILATEFPNRILLSEKNQSQDFENSFRDLRGFNSRDYGIEYGPITKIVNVNGMLLSIHYDGILGIGVDEKTLVAEGSDVFVNTAEALSTKAITFSSKLGSRHAESICSVESAVLGVDYLKNTVWLFNGKDVVPISDFAVLTIIKAYKEDIETGSFTTGSRELYEPRVYTTFDNVKKTFYISYVAERADPEGDRKHYLVGTLSYNLLTQKWVSERSDGNKFAMYINSDMYTTGLAEGEYLLGQIWKEDALFNPRIPGMEREHMRCKFRGQDYNHSFEITVNDYSTVEKILENLRLICNKSVPIQVIYETSGDVNDAAINIWGEHAKTTITQQTITTRNNSGRNYLRLGILDENAYYKNSNLFIEVGKVGFTRADANNKRIRDKHIRIKFIYTGNNKTMIQGIVSTLGISYN